MKTKTIGKKAIRAIHGIINLSVLTLIVLSSAFAGYALWDTEQIFQSADKSHYTVYKPQEADEGKSFLELQAINDEVFAWLSVYGTNIDYPVTQGPDNMKYVNTNAEGEYSLSGAIFLDYGNSRDFSDFNGILYGHHMEKKTMFGEIGFFAEDQMFDTHLYGNMYYDGVDHGIEFFAFVHTDAYDAEVFTPDVGDELREAYLDGLLAKAMHRRDMDISIEDHIILLSTCSSDSTNGRDILIGRITDRVYDDPFVQTQTKGKREEVSVDSRRSLLENAMLKDIIQWPQLLKLVIAIRQIVFLLVDQNRKKRREKRLRLPEVAG